MKKEYLHQGSGGELYWIQFFEDDRLARACLIDNPCPGPTFQAVGDTIEEAENLLLAKIQQHKGIKC